MGPTGPSGFSAIDPLPSGQSISGAVGGDFEASGSALDWGVIQSLPLPAPVGSPIGDNSVLIVIVNDAATGWGDNSGADTIPTTDTTLQDTKCGGAIATCCPGDTSNPTATAGFVCIYVSSGTNAMDVNGTSVINSAAGSSGASRLGFKLNWTNVVPGETYIDAVWAYTAP